MEWFQFADFHFGKKNAQQQLAMASVVQFIREVLSHKAGKIDAIFILGDIAYSGQEEEYEKFERDFLKPLLSIPSVKDAIVIAVPGNHDVTCDASAPLPGKNSQMFWAAHKGGSKWLETDILIEKDGRMMVLDAKWKRPERHPADDDLKQMFAYNLMWKSNEAWLVYPKIDGEPDRSGTYSFGEAGRLGMTFVGIFDETGRHLNKRLSLPKFPE